MHTRRAAHSGRVFFIKLAFDLRRRLALVGILTGDGFDLQKFHGPHAGLPQLVGLHGFLLYGLCVLAHGACSHLLNMRNRLLGFRLDFDRLLCCSVQYVTRLGLLSIRSTCTQ